MNKYLDKAGLQDYTTKLTAKYDDRYATHAMVGSPLVAATAADMTDTTKVYVYAGSETGYTNGDWYYYDGSEWQDGGVYNSAAIVLDDTLTQPDEAAEAKAVGDALANKANIDGSYADLTAGNAEALVTNLSETSLTPYNFQTTGGSVETGNRVNIKKVIYGSVVVNQLANIASSSRTTTTGGVTFTDNRDGSYTISTDENGATSNAYLRISDYSATVGHTYALRLKGVGQGVMMWLNGAHGARYDHDFAITSQDIGTYFFLFVTTGTVISTPVTVWPNVHDLTQWYGSTETADHIYLMESASTGRGVSFMQTQYPVLNGGYIPYNTGTLLSSNPSKHEANGFNWWDEEWEVGYYDTAGAKALSSNYIRSKNNIRVISGQTYYFQRPAGYTFYVCQYDIQGGFISRTSLGTSTTLTLQSNTYFITFCIGGSGTPVTTYNNDICISDHWDDTRNGDYEAWVLHSYAIDKTVDGHGIFKFKPQAASPWTYTDHLTDEMYVDGDTLEPDGTLTARYGIIDLGTVVFTYNAERTAFGASGALPLAKGAATSEVANAICPAYVAKKYAEVYTTNAKTMDKVFAIASGTHSLYIYDSSKTASDLDAEGKASWLNGVYLYYELETPTTSQKDPYQETMIVDNWGWEILNDYAYDNGNRAVQIPVGTESVYPVNLVDKLEAAPDNPTADGFYIVKKNGNSTEYVAYVGELPSDPASDGTYTLKATVSSGSVTKSWVADA